MSIDNFTVFVFLWYVVDYWWGLTHSHWLVNRTLMFYKIFLLTHLYCIALFLAWCYNGTSVTLQFCIQLLRRDAGTGLHVVIPTLQEALNLNRIILIIYNIGICRYICQLSLDSITTLFYWTLCIIRSSSLLKVKQMLLVYFHGCRVCGSCCWHILNISSRNTLASWNHIAIIICISSCNNNRLW
jgi:hypothetical protein